ncbi:MAG: group II intron reverse transcriptase/maturase [Clostridiaceae bacterium]|nr:group II intron reverse transcriptase/maturase [Clostridiaceae bacterium]HZW97934.1 group II intron reverse transcriptase/maturase [Bacillota bacterium]
MPQLMEKILSPENMNTALKKVKSNKGAGGIDGIEMKDIDAYITANWAGIRERILKRKYKPHPVLRVEIPKASGGVRKLGIPTIMDRVIEQAIVQVITPIVEPHFSEYSYGFRPQRRAQQAIIKMLEHLNEGYEYIVDIDLEKFFDNVPQDKLMTLVGKILQDPDTESLISKYLKAGVMVEGKYEDTKTGTPQGGNLSPILSNIMLNELDKELEQRGLRFVRYADDCIITVKSSAAANRVMGSVTQWIERKLGLKVNAEKSRVNRPTKTKFLGFSFVKMGGKWEARPHKDSVKSFERKLKRLSKRSWSIGLLERIRRLNLVIRGWINYFRIGKMKSHMQRIDGRLRTRLRIAIWKQWKSRKKRIWGLMKLGVPRWVAEQSAGFGNHYQAVARTTGLRKISKEIFDRLGLVSCVDYYLC